MLEYTVMFNLCIDANRSIYNTCFLSNICVLGLLLPNPDQRKETLKKRGNQEWVIQRHRQS